LPERHCRRGATLRRSPDPVRPGWVWLCAGGPLLGVSVCTRTAAAAFRRT